MIVNEFRAHLFQMTTQEFDSFALQLFYWQAENVPIYKQYIEQLRIDFHKVKAITQIPFLPIRFFKSHNVINNHALQINQIFESSGTTGSINSKHSVSDIALYEESFMNGFQHFFSDVSQYCILGLLPSYLERGSSSLVYMVNHLIQKSEHERSGFYLHNYNELAKVIDYMEDTQQATLLFGVTYALIDFAEKYSRPLKYVKIIETGGMKGRREELTRDEVHHILKSKFYLNEIYSEYGMTELLSQAYSLSQGIFKTPNWMRVLVREINDPFSISEQGRGLLNIIDLANIYSCSFIATDDLGEVHDDKQFSINGRMDQSELRGCSLMLAEY
jgi:phenylacetate-coenzyme A ligase PaaK-like adenylate-forming protein